MKNNTCWHQILTPSSHPPAPIVVSVSVSVSPMPYRKILQTTCTFFAEVEMIHIYRVAQLK